MKRKQWKPGMKKINCLLHVIALTIFNFVSHDLKCFTNALSSGQFNINYKNVALGGQLNIDYRNIQQWSDTHKL